jgi:hypothetical protein
VARAAVRAAGARLLVVLLSGAALVGIVVVVVLVRQNVLIDVLGVVLVPL